MNVVIWWLFTDLPRWWPALVLLDLIIAFHMSRVFAARMLAWDETDVEHALSSGEVKTIKNMGLLGGIFWPFGLVAWGVIRTGGWLSKHWRPSVDQQVAKIINQRNAKAQQSTLGKLTDRDVA